MFTVVGSPVRRTATFTDTSGNPLTQPGVTYTVTPPTGSVVTGAATNDSTGVYHFDYTPTQAGIHQYYFTGNSISTPDVFTVSPATTGALVSLFDAKEQLNKAATSVTPGSTDDSEILRFIHAASHVVNHVTGYTVRTAFTDWLTPNWGTPGPNLGVYGSGYISLTLSKSPVLAVTAIQPLFYNVAALDLSGVVIDNEAGTVWLPMNQLFLGPCNVSYTAGRTFVPENLQVAALLIVQQMWETQRGPASARGGPLNSDDTVVIPGLGVSVPSRAMELMTLSPFRAAPGFA